MNNKVPILIIGNFLSETPGLRTVCEDFARLLTKAGWKVITTSKKPGRIFLLIDMLNTVWSRRRDYELACIDTYSGPAFLWAEVVGFALRLIRKSFILILHGGDLPIFGLRWPGRVSRLLNSASVVISPSRYLQEMMRSYRSDIKVIPNSIDLRIYPYRLRNTVSPKLIWLRKFHRIYNPSLAPRIMVELKKQQIEGSLSMVGPDKGDGSLEEMLRLSDELNVRPQICIINGIPKDQVPGQLSQADIFINTTNIDNTPISVIEAMACGLCIVSTNVGGIPYLLEDEKDALLVQPNDQVAMAKAIWRILTEPGLAVRLSFNARAKAEQFDWDVVLPSWEHLLIIWFTMPDRIQIYHQLPYPLKVVTASLWGYYLRGWRYGKRTEELVEEALERDKWSHLQWKEWQEKRLEIILHRAVKYVPYYRDQWDKRRRSGDRSSWEYLANWYILSKEEIRKNPRAFLSDDSNHKRLYVEHTSGTTGSPLQLWCSRSMLQEWYALFEARWRRWYGLSFNDRWGMLGGQLIVPFNKEKPPFWVWNQGLNQLYLSVMHLRPDWIPYYVEAIKKYSCLYLYGYTSALYQLAFEMLQKGNKLELKAVITDAEPLFDYQRKVISEGFCCPVYETYGQAEMVAAASECKNGSLHLWPEVGISESVDDNGFPAEDGTTGRLVATGLLNDDMPLVRYDMLDMIAFSHQRDCKCDRELPVLQAIYGRKDDVILTQDGRRITQIDTIFNPELHIKEAQIIQEDLGYFRIKVVPAPGWSAVDAKEIISSLRKRVGDIRIDIEQVLSIERTWRGKFRIIISKVTNPRQENL